VCRMLFTISIRKLRLQHGHQMSLAACVCSGSVVCTRNLVYLQYTEGLGLLQCFEKIRCLRIFEV
jgi:hypothetical protein